MKNDISRNTFVKTKHFSRVLLQQGRVQMDTDWNEQQDIVYYQSNSKTADIVGPAGAPVRNDGFELAAAFADFNAEVQAREANQDPPTPASNADLLISAGHFYLDGILLENEEITTYLAQPHFRSNEVDGAGTYFAYLDVWERHVTALEDAAIREVALGGPDTATRAQTIWQVRLVRVGDTGAGLHCHSLNETYNEATAAMTGVLAARAEPAENTTSPCIVPADAGYRRLENQLYRVEVHASGTRGRASFKWSRDNGSVVARWEAMSDDRLTVSQSGKDKYLVFAPGQWVELIDDERVLRQEPGTLVRIVAVVDRVLTIDPATADGSVDLADFGSNPKIRRWDSDGVLEPGNMQFIELEDGVEISLRQGTYRTGDYWLIPARTNTRSIEWPVEEGSTTPLYLLPKGVEHHYTRLGVLEHDGSTWTSIEDCRRLFPPLTQLITLKYLGGDGQEAMPDTSVDTTGLDTSGQGTRIPLNAPLRVGVINGGLPLAGATVQFEISTGNGEINGSSTTADVITDEFGTAEVAWSVDDSNTTQQVTARLLEFNDDVEHASIQFTANLSIAAEVAYTPGCNELLDTNTVQGAIDSLCRLFRRCTSYSIGPNDDVRGILESITDGENASICFERGEYTFRESIRISNAGHLKITGSGFATRFYSPDSEAALIIENCASILASDFYAEAGIVGTEGDENTLQGPLTLLNTPIAFVHRLHLVCGDGEANEATCLTIRHDIPRLDAISRNNVLVTDCLFSIGHYQTGVLVVNTQRAMICNNSFNSERVSLEPEPEILPQVGFKGIVVAGHYLEHATIQKNTLHFVGEGIRVALSDQDTDIELTSKVTIENNLINTRVVPPRENCDTAIFVGNARITTIRNNEVTAELLYERGGERDRVPLPPLMDAAMRARLGTISERNALLRIERYSLQNGIYVHGYFGVYLDISDNVIRYAETGIQALSENTIDVQLAQELVLWKIRENVVFGANHLLVANPAPAFFMERNIFAQYGF